MEQRADTSAILQNLKLEALNPMQEAAISAYAEGNDLVLLSPTGTGKTLAYLIPLAQSLRTDVEGVQAVILVPSRELALQIDGVFKAMCTGFRSMCCYGGRPAMDEHRTMQGIHPQVIVGTPGRMNDHLNKNNFDSLTVGTLIIDEFDKCLELGFQDEMSQVLDRLPAVHRRVLLSATDADEIPRFVGMSQRGVTRLNFLGETQPVAERIRLYTVHSPEKDKLSTLYRLLCTLGAQSSLVFVNYREAVERVANYLKDNGVACEMFHGGLEQPDRERALYKFSNGSCNVFVSTDLAARGLDIPAINNIIHYHLPANEEAYIHRNGRTARWAAEGNSYLLLGPEEAQPAYISASENFDLLDQTPRPTLPEWVTLYIGKGKKDKLNKVDIAGFLYKVGGLQRDDIGRIDVKDRYAFVAIRRQKMKQTLNLINGNKIKGIKTVIEVTR